jgi:hypothetical protein
MTTSEGGKRSAKPTCRRADHTFREESASEEAQELSEHVGPQDHARLEVLRQVLTAVTRDHTASRSSAGPKRKAGVAMQ